MSIENPGLSSNNEQYKKNFTEEERAGHLPEDKAHDMANMMKVEMGVDPKRKGKIQLEGGEWVSREEEELVSPTKEDYEKAFLKVEELEKLAGENTPIKDILLKIKRFSRLTLEGYKDLWQSTAGIITGPALVSKEEKEERFNRYKELKEIYQKFNSAKEEFNNLKEKGNDWGEANKSIDYLDNLYHRLYNIVRVDEDGTLHVEPKKNVNQEEVLENFFNKK